MKCDPETAYHRIGERGRTAEKSIELDYLKKVHEYHEDWFKRSGENYNILELDCNKDFEKDSKFREDVLINIDLMFFS